MPDDDPGISIRRVNTPDWYMTAGDFAKLVTAVAVETSTRAGLKGRCHPVDLAAHWSITAENVGEVIAMYEAFKLRKPPF